jgi:hypothetical protein
MYHIKKINSGVIKKTQDFPDRTSKFELDEEKFSPRF